MKIITLAIFVILDAVAASPCSSKCCFGLCASGAANGTVGQITDGQNRVGGPLPPAQFCITGSSITDAQGRGCLVTCKLLLSLWQSPTSAKENFNDRRIITDVRLIVGVTQWQCDLNQPPIGGFTIGDAGQLAYNGSSTFFECQTGEDDEANIYTTPAGNTNCLPITLIADRCGPESN